CTRARAWARLVAVRTAAVVVGDWRAGVGKRSCKGAAVRLAREMQAVGAVVLMVQVVPAPAWGDWMKLADLASRAPRVFTPAGADAGRPGLDDVDGHQVRELVAESTAPSSSRDYQRGLVGTRVIVDIRGQVLAIRGMTRMASTWAKRAKRARRAKRTNGAKRAKRTNG